METGIFLITMTLIFGVAMLIIIGVEILKKLETRNGLLEEQNEILKGK